MKYRPLVCAVILLLTVTLIVGCGPAGREKVKTVEVSGTVTMDGEPLDGAEVNLLGEEYAGITTTDGSGNFSMEAQPGTNKVYIRKFEGVGPEFDATMTSPGDAGGGGADGPKQLVPAKYSDPDKTELTFSVPEDGTESANFDLSSK